MGLIREEKRTVSASISQLVEVRQVGHFGSVEYILYLIRSNLKCIFKTSVTFILMLVYLDKNLEVRIISYFRLGGCYLFACNNTTLLLTAQVYRSY